jgi:hypothetical protein
MILFQSSTYWYMRAHPLLTWFTSCRAVLARVKAAESQWPKGTPIQAKSIYYLSAGAALQRPAGAAGAVVHGAAVQGRRHDRRRRRRRRRRRPRSRQAADEDLDGDVVGGDKFASEKSCQSDLQLEDALAAESCCQGCAVVMLMSQRT